MTLNLTDDEARALAKHLRQAIDYDPYPLAPPASSSSGRVNSRGSGLCCHIAMEDNKGGMKPYCGPPMMLGNAAAARVCFVVGCLGCRRRVEPDPAEMAKRHGVEVMLSFYYKKMAEGD